MEDAMDDRDTSRELWRLSLQQHVSLEKHRQMIWNTLRWQEVCKLANEQPKAAATAPRTTLITQLQLLLKSILAKRGEVSQQCSCDMEG
jgi:hypothetical protein